MPYNPNMRVLVVDDFSTMRRIVRNILRQIGFQNVVEADDGTSAWEVLNREKIDFIVSDWNMPQMTGIDLLRKVRAVNNLQIYRFLWSRRKPSRKILLRRCRPRCPTTSSSLSPLIP